MATDTNTAATKLKDPLKPMTAFTEGIIRNNPILVMLLGLCPVMVATESLFNALGMSVAVLFVLFFSNLIVSTLNKVIEVPSEIRIPIYIVIIASLVTVVDLLLQAYAPELSESLGMFIPLITVNCIILGRAEAFASRHSVKNSVLDALGMAIGFALACFIIAFFREFIGTGGLTIKNPLSGEEVAAWLPLKAFALPIMTTGTGGFMMFGIVIGLFVPIAMTISRNYARRKERRRLLLAEKAAK